MLNYNVRWANKNDVDEILDIERRSFKCPWRKNEFFEVFRRRCTTGKVAADSATGRIVGYIIYSFWRKNNWQHLQKVKFIETMAVHPEERGIGLGRLLLNDLSKVLATPGENAVMAEVGEQNLEAQLFFRHMGFRAVAVEHGFFNDGQDSYRMILQNKKIDRSWVVLFRNKKSV